MNWKKKTGILLGSIIFVAVMSFLFTFTACGKTPESTACVHEWGEYTAIKDATCTEKGIKERQCAKCGETEKEEIAALGHTEVVDEAIEPTCTEAGKTEGKHCSVCHEVLVAQEEIAALGHTEVVDEEVAPTCAATGKTAGKHCSVCHEVLVAQEEIAALGHTEVVDEEVAPTCAATGRTAGKHCSVCGEIIVAQEEIAALGHTYVNEICTRCGEHEPTKELKYLLNEDRASYTVVGIENENDITEVYIPSVYKGKPVTSIGKKAFSASNLMSIIIPNSVTSIGEYVFYGCSSLTSVTLSEKLPIIAGSTFWGCVGLTSITLPESLTSIKRFAFYDCSSLMSINIPNGVTRIGEYAINSERDFRKTQQKISNNIENSLQMIA